MDPRLDHLLRQYANPPGADARVTGPHRAAEVVRPVEALRRRVYGASSPHLLGPVVAAAEQRLRLDERTQHLCAWVDGSLTAALRVSAEPIELPTLSPRCAELAAGLPDHGEISRVISDPAIPRLEHVSRLFALMVHTMVDQGATVGVLGICRRRVVRLYARFGMVAVHDDPLTIAGRPDDDYFVVAARFDRMVEVGMHRLLRVDEQVRTAAPVPPARTA